MRVPVFVLAIVIAVQATPPSDPIFPADPLRKRTTSYHLEAAPTLERNQGRSLLTLNMGGESIAWSDPSLALNSAQFFRLRSADLESESDFASTFRLLDAQGVAHDLHYHSETLAIVALAAETNLDPAKEYAPVLNELSEAYAGRVQIWVLLSDRAASSDRR
jgi:hypothetical protein